LVHVEPFGVAGGLSQLRGQRGKPGTDEEHRRGDVGLSQRVDRHVDGLQVGAGGFLQLVDQQQGADPELQRGVTDHLQEGGEVLAEPAAVGDAVLRLDLGAEGDAVESQLQREGLQHRERALEFGPAQMPARGRAHRLGQLGREDLPQRHRRGRLHLRHDPLAGVRLTHQLVEQHRLADPAEPGDDPTPVTLAVLLSAAQHHVEVSEDAFSAGEDGRTATGTGSERVQDRIHVSETITPYKRFPYEA